MIRFYGRVESGGSDQIEEFRRYGRSALSEDDAALGEVVGRELHLDAVAGENADEVLAHFAADKAEDLVVAAVGSRRSLNIAFGSAWATVASSSM